VLHLLLLSFLTSPYQYMFVLFTAKKFSFGRTASQVLTQVISFVPPPVLKPAAEHSLDTILGVDSRSDLLRDSAAGHWPGEYAPRFGGFVEFSTSSI
jgi:hypothetical protein